MYGEIFPKKEIPKRHEERELGRGLWEFAPCRYRDMTGKESVH